MKIVVLDGYTENPGDLSWGALEALGELTVYDRTPADKAVERIGDAEVVYTNKTPLNAHIIKNCPTIKFIGVLATGYNIIDMAATKAAGIVVSNIPSYGTNAVSQYAIALLLELCHHVGAHSDSVLAGEWAKHEDWCYWKYPLVELAGKTFGVIGFGRIGRRTAEIASALGMEVLAYDEYSDQMEKTDFCRYVSMNELLGQADVISLHCPLTPSTEKLVNQSTISKMKAGVKIINTSRGALIDEQDLCNALDSGKISGAAVDVISEEPIRADNPLLHAKNIIITPHIAWAPKESRQRLMGIAVDNLKAFIDEKPINVVNQ